MIKPVIKWSGSKRTQAETIKKFFPSDMKLGMNTGVKLIRGRV